MGQLAIYPGSFDPVTSGHIDIIKRAHYIFDDVIVAVSKNIRKDATFSSEERVEMIKEATKSLKNIQVEVFDGLIIDFARRKKSKVLVRGIRMLSDFEYEFQMALTNRRLAEDVETVFLMPSENHSFVSSTLLKEVVALGADISSFVPDFVATKLKERLK